MGNILPSYGIKDHGESKMLICEKCESEFEGKINVITIKGPTPDPKYCQMCKNENTREIMENFKFPENLGR